MRKKDFIAWFQCKNKTEINTERLQFKEREVWYVRMGENIGFELDGKENFLRPCLVIKKISAETFYAIPLTSKLKNGTWYYPSFINNTHGRYVFSQMRVIDTKRLHYFVTTISRPEFQKIKQQFIQYFLS
jgi:mRNA interferase MazF